MSVRDAFGESNVREIKGLNQRGGRTLSFCDLIEAGTLSAQMAGELAALVESGAAILTAARPGGAGKSTVLANLLACLPVGERILTTPDGPAVEAARIAPPGTPTCFLAHEIGSGPWYAYLWGEAAARFFGLSRTGHRVASCLHADTTEELYDLLGSQGVPEREARSVGLVAFVVRRQSSRHSMRRVGSVYVAAEGVHRLRWRWDEASDTFQAAGDPAADPGRARELARFFTGLAEEGVRDFAEQRRRLADVLEPRTQW